VENKLFPEWFSKLGTFHSDTSPIRGFGETDVLSMSVDLMTDKDINAWLNGGIWLYVVGRISYADESGPHYTDFCRDFLPLNIHTPRLLPSRTPLLERWLDCGTSDSAPITF
jgi:hypothetical protein